MRRIRLAWIPAVFFFFGMAFGRLSDQNIFPFKDLVFPQVAAGGAYESWITLTNRGSEVWYGNLKFYSGARVPWNPVVNTVPVAGGTLAISLNPGMTRTYKVTLSGSTEAGYVMAMASNLNLTNFIEGHLTYYVSNGKAITDSVGVPPAKQFRASSLPFEDLASICLAFVNTDPEGRSANLKLKIVSDLNAQVGQTKSFTLTNGEHTAQYLNQLFPSITLSRGRLEVESDVSISGIALTQATGEQLSSLPFESTGRTYVVQGTGGHPNIFNRITLWTESFYVKGYAEVLLSGGGWDFYALSGQIVDGKLHLHFDGYWNEYEWFGYIKSDGIFSAEQPSFTGIWYTAWPPDVGFETGTFVAILVP
jgi:hypothetical protein